MTGTESLYKTLTKGEPHSRRQAAWELGEVGDLSALVPLGAAAVSDRSRLVRREARQAVEKVCARAGADLRAQALLEPDLLRELVLGLESDHPETREWAMRFAHPRLVAKLIPDGEGVPGAPPPRETLLTLVQGRSGLTKMGWWAGLVLAELGERQAVVPLSRALCSRSEKVRRWLLQVVGEMGYLRLVEFLVGALEERKSSVRQRRAAALGLGGLGHPAALPKLREKARFWSWEDFTVKAACRKAIRQIEERGVAALPTATPAPVPATDTLPRPVIPGVTGDG